MAWFLLEVNCHKRLAESKLRQTFIAVPFILFQIGQLHVWQ